jgi:tetratricopeptide (TPR) repeat protein
MSPHRVLSSFLTILLCFGSGLTWANGSAEIEELIRNKQWTLAEQKLQLAIKQTTQTPATSVSPQFRFMSSQILAGQGQLTQAIQELQALIQEFPELPEPYNNLGVLYAAQGQYDAALTAFTSAIQARPNYKIAHQNLGDLYTAMAQQAFSRAKDVKEGSGLLPLPAPSAVTTPTTKTQSLR